MRPCLSRLLSRRRSAGLVRHRCIKRAPMLLWSCPSKRANIRITAAARSLAASRNFMESCPAGDSDEGFIAIPEAGGYYELENQGDSECATAVALSDAIAESTCSPNSGNEWTIPGSYSGK